ncbi:hypothetical protein P280DRAFT_157400 [Massarina eburnea CBS 473.64]|uniref:Uncharacterized protein n=1 Tax=Massarina eburnea CBS 473.64 TaxID=1395130 RepID=A0A6A6RLR3_9PLEO|nr:hypothetical protein P280DRAFT_157400 [Massarina eburnea CBS 473.64]
MLLLRCAVSPDAVPTCLCGCWRCCRGCGCRSMASVRKGPRPFTSPLACEAGRCSRSPVSLDRTVESVCAQVELCRLQFFVLR